MTRKVIIPLLAAVIGVILFSLSQASVGIQEALASQWVDEPAALLLLGSSLIVLAAWARKKFKKGAD